MTARPDMMMILSLASTSWAGDTNSEIVVCLSHPRLAAFPPYSSSVAQLPVDEPPLAWTMTHDHAKDLCASEISPLRT